MSIEDDFNHTIVIVYLRTTICITHWSMFTIVDDTKNRSRLLIYIIISINSAVLFNIFEQTIQTNSNRMSLKIRYHRKIGNCDFHKCGLWSCDKHIYMSTLVKELSRGASGSGFNNVAEWQLRCSFHDNIRDSYVPHKINNETTH